DEEKANYECPSGDVCCVEKTQKKKSYWWIWVLVILIILAVLGIIFKDKLRPLWFKIKSKFPKIKKGPKGPKPSMKRPIMPQQRRPLPPRKPVGKPKSDMEDVLKKLRDMGK
ncbi:MAG: hypothetical protein P8X70_03065, partial [Nanoarchaeota archaeon]